MKRLLIRLILPILACEPSLVFLPSAAAGTSPRAVTLTSNSILRAWPSEGHSGDVVWLSGSGLPPNRSLYILVACPNLTSGQTIEWGNAPIIAVPPNGPRTDSQGEFSRWSFHAIKLSHVTRSGCLIYTTDGRNQYGPDFPGTYFILASGDRTKRCDREICVNVRPRPRRVHSGLVENIDIDGWGGATANVSVQFPGTSKAKYSNVALDWNGSAHLRVPVPAGITTASRARIVVRCRLGRYGGEQRAQFTVVH